MIAGAAAIAIATHGYLALFERTLGYLIVPVDGRLFRVELTTDLDGCEPWRPMVPMLRCPGARISLVELVGDIQNLIAQSRLKQRLVKDGNYKELSRLLEAQLNADFKLPLSAMDFYQLDCFSLESAKPDQIPKDLSFLLDGASASALDADVASCALAHSGRSRAMTIEALHGAILLRGRTARVLSYQLE